MNRLLIVGDHPSLHRGFSSVGRHLARYLHRSGRWRVQFLGRYPRAAAAGEEPYQVFDVDAVAEEVDGGDERRFRDLLRVVIGDDPTDPRPTLLLSIGTPYDQRIVLESLEGIGRRSLVRLVGYMPVDYAPLPPASADLLGRIDVLVPFTAFARRALAEICPGIRSPMVSAPIPHGVDLDTFHPPDVTARRNLRRDLFGVDEDEVVVIGYFGRNSGHKRPDLALRIFAAFARGEYVRCRACDRVAAHPIDPIDGTGRAPAACPRCGSARLETGALHANARFYMHTELSARVERRYAGGWDLRTLATRCGVQEQVRFDGSLRIGEGVTDSELAARMGACDIHLLPFEGGGWELTVLETGACGVANVITAVGAPAEYAAPFSELVPAAALLLGPTGTRAFIDIGRAVEALERLATQPGYRRRLALSGPRVAAAHSWSIVGRQWEELARIIREDADFAASTA